MTEQQFEKQFKRMTDEWPRAYGASKKAIFAREFAGHEPEFFASVVDHLLMKFRAPPQANDVWAAISEVKSKFFRRPSQQFKPSFNWTADPGDEL